jgi:hypothetical protein
MSGHTAIIDILPNPFLITEPAKTAEMIFICSQGLCGEDMSGSCEGRKPEHPW